MAFRRSRHSGRSRTKRRVYWYASDQSYASNIVTPFGNALAPGPATIPLQPATQNNVILVTNNTAHTNVPAGPQVMTVNNIRGQIHLFTREYTNPSCGEVFVQMGIIAYPELASGLTQAPSLALAGDADHPWLWMHGQFLSAPARIAGAGPTSVSVDVNIKTKRVLKGDDGLILVLIGDSELTPAAGQPVCLAAVRLRMLLSHSQ